MALASAVASIFEQGKLSVESYEKEQTDVSSPPTSVLVVTPTRAGQYPVTLFLHGFCLNNNYYRQLLGHIASHGYIAVAPKLPLTLFPSSERDVEAAAAVAEWLPRGLPSVLPTGVEGNLLKLALAGHSKGGHSAFALALKKPLDFSVLVGIDPVAGRVNFITGQKEEVSPKILTYTPNSLDISIPVLVVGSGLGEEKQWLVMPACAPEGLNHAEFYSECRSPAFHFVVKEYGHLDMLDDDAPWVVMCACKRGEGCRGRMRRSVAGLVVAFLEAYLGRDEGDLRAVIREPGVAPARLDPVEEK